MGKKVGLVIVLVGFCMPMVLFFFAKGYHPGHGLLGSVLRMKLVLGKPPLFATGIEVLAIPYKYLVAAGVTLIFIGIGFIGLSKPR